METLKKSPNVNVAKCIRDICRKIRIYPYEISLPVYSFIINKNHRLHGNEVFIWAARRGDESIVRYLVENGVDIHIGNDLALRWAAEYGHESVVRYLANNGADIHVFNEHALQLAAENGHKSIARYLMKNITSDNIYYDIARSWTFARRNDLIVEYLGEKYIRPYGLR